MQIARLALFEVNEKKELPEKEPALSWDQAVVKVINLPLDQSAVIDGAWTGAIVAWLAVRIFELPCMAQRRR